MGRNDDSQATTQLERSRRIEAPPGAVYALFMDNARLAEWAPAVERVVHEEGGDERGVGRTRTCAVTLAGKGGTMVERCVDAVPGERASFAVVGDSFGFDRMLRGYGFTAHFSPEGDATRVRLETVYAPAHPVAALLNALVLRRRFRGVVDDLLAGLARVAEAEAEAGRPGQESNLWPTA